MTETRSERLGLEPGSINTAREIVERSLGGALPVQQREIQHSIAISLKRIADQGAQIAADMAEIKARRPS